MLPARVVDSFLSLLRAGLWERPEKLSALDEDEWSGILRLAQEQSVVGLVGAGLDHCPGQKLPKPVRNELVATTYGTEKRNAALDSLLTEQVSLLESSGVPVVVLKGQGIGRCYARPQWRQPGDIDYLFDGDGYANAKTLLIPGADTVHHEDGDLLHLPLAFGDIEVELHGSVNTDLSRRMDAYLAGKKREMFARKDFRYIRIGACQVPLPCYQFDAVFVFTHILHHLYQGGIGLRQICDWTRLLHVCHGKLDLPQLESDIRNLGILEEWQAFGSFAVAYLGLDLAEMPLVENLQPEKASRILAFFLQSGNFGTNLPRRNLSFKNYWHRKISASLGRSSEILQVFRLFPRKTMLYLFAFLINGLRKSFQGR